MILHNSRYHPILAHVLERLLNAWMKYRPKVVNYDVHSNFYSVYENVFQDAVDKVPKYSTMKKRHQRLITFFCPTMLMAYYLRAGNDYPLEFTPGQNPTMLLTLSYQDVYNKTVPNFVSNRDSVKKCEKDARELLVNRTSAYMKFRLHLIDHDQLQQELPSNPVVQTKHPRRKKRSAKKF